MKTRILERVNLEEVKNKEVICRVRENGGWYPDLYTQGLNINQLIERHKDDIVEVAQKLDRELGSEPAKVVIDSMYHYMIEFFETVKDYNESDESVRKNVLSDMYERTVVAKALIDLHYAMNNLMSLERDIELTNAGVLM